MIIDPQKIVAAKERRKQEAAAKEQETPSGLTKVSIKAGVEGEGKPMKARIVPVNKAAKVSKEESIF